MCRDLQNFKRVMDTNVFGAFAAVQAFYPLLKVSSGSWRSVVLASTKLSTFHCRAAWLIDCSPRSMHGAAGQV